MDRSTPQLLAAARLGSLKALPVQLEFNELFSCEAASCSAASGTSIAGRAVADSICCIVREWERE